MTSKGLSKKQLKIRESLADIFDQCQKTLAVHKSSLSRIAKLHKQDPEFFQIEFKNIVNRVLIVSKREPAVERVVSFIIKSALKVASLNDDEPDEDTNKSDSEDEDSEKSKKKKKKSPRKTKARDSSDDEEEEEENSDDDEPQRAKPKKKAKSSPKKKKPSKPTKEQEIKVDFAIELVRYLLDVSNAKDKGVRFRSCQMVAGLMQGFEEIDNALWDDVEDRMMTRIHDRFPSVRCQAVQALSRLQEPNSMNDKVTKAYLELLRTDTSKDVRKHVLQCIGLSKYTLEDILVKSRDRSEDVRKACFAILCEKIDIEKLTVTQRASLLKDGLCDRDEGVKNSAIQMCDAWFTNMGEDPIKFLRCLDIEENEEVAEIAVRALLANRENISINIIVDDIDRETALFWRLYCENLKQVKNEEALENCLPVIDDFCKYVEFYKNDEYILRQFFTLAKLIDYAAHEMGRRELSSMLRRMLPNKETSTQLSNVIMQLLQKLHPDESDLIQQITEIISEILDPIETENRWEKDSPSQWIQCLTITEDLLEHIRRAFHHPGIAGLLESVILPAIQDQNLEVRNKGIRCLGLFCLLNVEDAKKHLLLFLQIVKNDREMIKVTALKVLFDFIMAFGIKPFEEENNFEEILSQDYSQLSQPSIPLDDSTSKTVQDCALISTLDRFLDASHAQIRSTVVEGFAKIMTCGYFDSVSVLTKLFLAFFDPTTEKLVSLRQCLTIFFSTYASFPKHKGLIAKAFRPTIRTILSASKRSSLRDVQISDVVNIMLSLISQGQTDLSQLSTYYESLAQEIIDEILEDPEGHETKQLCKALTLLGFSKSTPNETVKTLKHYAKMISKNLTDKNAVRSLEKFATMLTSLDTLPDKMCEKAKEIESRVGKAFGKEEEKKKEEEKEDVVVEEEEHDEGYIPVSPPIIDASGASVVAEATPQKETSTPAKKKAKGDFYQQQSDYYNEIDNYKVPGISTKKRKSSLRKSTEGVKKKVTIEETPKEWIEEKNKLVTEREKMMQEIELLKKQLAEKESPTKKQKTETTPMKRAKTVDLSKPPTKAKTPEKPPTTTTPATKSKPTVSSSQRKKVATVTVSDSEAEGNKDMSEEDVSGAEDNVKKSNKKSDEEEKKKMEEEEKIKASNKRKSEEEKSKKVETKKKKTTAKGKKEEEEKEETKEEEEEEEEKSKKVDPKKKKTTAKRKGKKEEEEEPEKKDDDADEEKEQPPTKTKSKSKKSSKKLSPKKKQQQQLEETDHTASEEEEQESRKRKPTEDLKKKPSPKKLYIPEIITLLPSMSPKPTSKSLKSKSPKSSVKRIMVAFSGFKNTDSKYNETFQEDLQDRVLLLQGTIAEQETFDSKITHVILPPNTRTMKTLAASLTKRWLVSEKWILDSTEAGFFLEESAYGWKRETCPFEGKKVFISGDFYLANRDKNIKEQSFKLLIEQLGKGKIVSKPTEADYVLVANNAKDAYSGTQLTWAQFFDLIQPPMEELSK